MPKPGVIRCPAATMGAVHVKQPLLLSASPCPHQDGLLQRPFEMRKHLLVIHMGKQDAGKAHFPRLRWGLSQWSWEMHVLAAATRVKQTALGLPHSAEQRGSRSVPVLSSLPWDSALSQTSPSQSGTCHSVPAEAGTGFDSAHRCCCNYTKRKD